VPYIQHPERANWSNSGESRAPVEAMTLTERLLYQTVTQQSELSEFGRTRRAGRLPQVSKS
ncbi:MAG: hypothetical protein QOJ17_5992, partial [Rhodospirillaceae bacterium]|nr:hypothetical protein [Rhodospirillaceae bacterium]